MNFKRIDVLADRFFKVIDQPFIPLLRIFLVLISMKEAYTVLQKLELYFGTSGFFHRDDALSNFLFPIFEDYRTFILYAVIIFGFGATIGLLTRVSLALYAVVYFSLMYFDVNMGIYNHEAGLTVQILFILVFAPGVKNLSLDKFLESRGSFKSFFTITPYNNWALRLVLILIAVGYFTAGISKVRYGGTEWLDGNTLSYYLSGKSSHRNEVAQKFVPSQNSSDWRQEIAIDAYTYGNFQTNPTFTGLAKSLSDNKVVMMILSIFTVLFEVAAVFILFSNPFRSVFFLMAVGFHFSIRILMGLGFLDYQVICLSLVDWKYLYDLFASKLLKRSR